MVLLDSAHVQKKWGKVGVTFFGFQNFSIKSFIRLGEYLVQ